MNNLKKQVKEWWNKHPMDYTVKFKEGTKEFYQAIDRYFFEQDSFGHDNYPIFSKLIDYKSLKGKNVLEVGCGLGIILGQFAKQGVNATGIDITQKAIKLTKKRLEVFRLKGNTLIADAENLPFKGKSFDFVFSWGVLHHTPNTEKSINEIYRVLKSQGKSAIMLYHKSSILHYYHILFKKGLLKLEFLKHSKNKIVNRYTDAADKGGTPLAKVYTKNDAQKMFRNFKKMKIKIFGTKSEIENIPAGRFPLIKWLLPGFLKDKILKRYGWFLFIEVEK